MRSRAKYAAAFFAAVFLMLAVAAAAFLSVSRGGPYGYGGFDRSEAGLVYMRVGEAVGIDTGSGDLIRMHGSDGGQDVFLDGKGRLHAVRAGRYEVYTDSIRVFFGDELIADRNGSYIVVAQDTDFSDYIPVDSYSDIGTEGKYILEAPLTVDRGAFAEKEMIFNGIIVNPYGYTVTIADGAPLFTEIGRTGIVSGLRVRFRGGVFDPGAAGITEGGRYIGPIACVNRGTLAECEAEGKLVASDGVRVCGVVGENSDTGIAYRCSFSGSTQTQPGGRIGGLISDGEEGIYEEALTADGKRSL